MRPSRVPRFTARLQAVLALAVLAFPFAASAQEATTVLVVRHAEKEWEDGDPPISEVGRERAEALMRLAGESGVSVLYATQYLRTKQTLEPIAARLGLEILVHDAGDSEGLASAILEDHAGEVVLVVGHSNTVTAIVAFLGAPRPPPIDDAEYDNLYVVTVDPRGDASTVVRLNFGRSPD